MSTLLIYLKGQSKKQDAAEIKSCAQSIRPKARSGEATERVNLAFSRIHLRQRSSKMFGDEDEAFVDIQFKALVECSKKNICGHNRTGDASPALDVHHMPTHVDKVGAMFRVVSAAARMISSCRLLIANKRLEECIDPYDTFIHVFSDDDIEQLYVRLEALHTSIMAAKSAKDFHYQGCSEGAGYLTTRS